MKWNLYPHFVFRREAAPSAGFSWQINNSGTVSPQNRLPSRLPKTLPSIVSVHSLFPRYEKSISYLVTAGPSHQAGDLPSQALCCSNGIEGDGCEGLIVVLCHHQGALAPPQHRRLQGRDTQQLEIQHWSKNCSSEKSINYANPKTTVKQHILILDHFY